MNSASVSFSIPRNSSSAFTRGYFAAGDGDFTATMGTALGTAFLIGTTTGGATGASICRAFAPLPTAFAPLPTAFAGLAAVLAMALGRAVGGCGGAASGCEALADLAEDFGSEDFGSEFVTALPAGEAGFDAGFTATPNADGGCLAVGAAFVVAEVADVADVADVREPTLDGDLADGGFGFAAAGAVGLGEDFGTCVTFVALVAEPAGAALTGADFATGAAFDLADGLGVANCLAVPELDRTVEFERADEFAPAFSVGFGAGFRLKSGASFGVGLSAGFCCLDVRVAAFALLDLLDLLDLAGTAGLGTDDPSARCLAAGASCLIALPDAVVTLRFLGVTGRVGLLTGFVELLAISLPVLDAGLTFDRPTDRRLLRAGDSTTASNQTGASLSSMRSFSVPPDGQRNGIVAMFLSPIPASAADQRL